MHTYFSSTMRVMLQKMREMAPSTSSFWGVSFENTLARARTIGGQCEDVNQMSVRKCQLDVRPDGPASPSSFRTQQSLPVSSMHDQLDA